MLKLVTVQRGVIFQFFHQVDSVYSDSAGRKTGKSPTFVRWVNMLNLNFVYHQLELPKMIFHFDLFLVRKWPKQNDLKIDVKKSFQTQTLHF